MPVDVLSGDRRISNGPPEGGHYRYQCPATAGLPAVRLKADTADTSS